MGLFSNFFRSSESSSDVAKRRLKVAITSDRAVCSPELMEQMKNDIIQVISKYVDIDTEGLDIKVTKERLMHFWQIFRLKRDQEISVNK
jgi:cell division topological specificity factor